MESYFLVRITVCVSVAFPSFFPCLSCMLIQSSHLYIGIVMDLIQNNKQTHKQQTKQIN